MKRGEISIAKHSPYLVKLAHGNWSPYEISHGCNQPKTWKCDKPNCEHIWEEPPSSLTGRGGKKIPCPVCANRITVVGVNDLMTTHPKISKEALGWSPQEYNASCSKQKMWRCSKLECSYEWLAEINRRVKMNSGCALCSNKVVVSGRNDLVTTHPHLLDEIDDNTVDPTKIGAGNRKRIFWKCRTCSHRWPAAICKRAHRKQQCPCCTNRIIVVGINDLGTTHPEITKELLHPEDAYTLTYGSDKHPQWICQKESCRYVWPAAVCIRVKQQTGCPCCNNTVVHVGCNDIATTHPEIAATLVDQSWAIKVSHGSEQKLDWICPQKNCNNTWKNKIYERITREACPSCTKTGYDLGKPGWLYLLKREINGQEQAQIGISNFIKNRLSDHKSNNWTPIETLGPYNGKQIYYIEQTFLTTIREKYKVRTGNKAFKKFDGYTEAWWSREYPVTSIADILKTCEITFDELQHEKEGKTTK